MTPKLALERPLTIAALTAITEGVMPVGDSNPIHLIWTLVRGLIRKA